jgi:hypothetical protein
MLYPFELRAHGSHFTRCVVAKESERAVGLLLDIQATYDFARA